MKNDVFELCKDYLTPANSVIILLPGIRQSELRCSKHQYSSSLDIEGNWLSVTVGCVIYFYTYLFIYSFIPSLSS